MSDHPIASWLASEISTRRAALPTVPFHKQAREAGVIFGLWLASEKLKQLEAAKEPANG